MEAIILISYTIGNKYSRKEIRALLSIPNPNNIGGIWSTGYVFHQNNFYIFATISNAGRTGHDYGNILIDDFLYWYTKNTDHLYVPTIKKMTSGEYPVHIFTRYDSTDPKFIYQGLGTMRDFENGKPAFISWQILPNKSVLENKTLSSERVKFIEGKKTTKVINIYERDPQARKKCIEHYGYICKVCSFNFEQIYGEIGKNFIHVHHEKELSLMREDYEVDPINDMKPVCPNCHSMLHKRKPAYSIEELKNILAELNV